MTRLHWYLAIEAVVFAVAALVHGGVLLDGYQHREALIAESIIAAVLLGGLVVSAIAPHRTRAAAIGAQAFALAGTAIGLFTIAIGIGPQTVPDVIYHILIVIVLATGLITAVRSRAHVVAR